jgi:PAS domain S-box-containing protein
VRQSEALLNQAQEVGQIGSWRWDVDSDKMYLSKEQFRIFGFDSSDTQVSRSLFLERIHPSDRDMLDKTIDRAIRRKEKYVQDYRIVLPDGSIKFLHSIAQPFVKPTGGVEIIGSVIDITERRGIEESLRSARSELAHAARLTTMGGLLASIAHEIKQPLAAVVMNANAGIRWLNREPIDRNEVRSALLEAASEGRRAGEIICSIYAMARRSEVNVAMVDLTAIVEEILLLMRGELEKHDLVTRIDFHINDREIYYDRVQLQQVFLNLIMNGVEAMNSVVDRPRLLEVSARVADATHLLVKVEDSGTGIDPAMAERMFDSFHTTKPTGMGIGLSICRSIVEAHGGRIWASRREPHGTALCFTVPTKPQDVLAIARE